MTSQDYMEGPVAAMDAVDEEQITILNVSVRVKDLELRYGVDEASVLMESLETILSSLGTWSDFDFQVNWENKKYKSDTLTPRLRDLEEARLGRKVR